jgi:SAM-dependent methyltransferase
MSDVPFDRAADCYDETRGGLERGRWNADVLLGWLATGRPALEIGVGTGLVAAALGERGVHVVGVDLSLPMLRRAVQRLPGRVAAGHAFHLPVRSQGVPAVYLVHVVHLIPDLTSLLREVRRVLTAAGRLLIVCAAEHERETDVARVLERLRDTLRGPRSDQPARIVAAALEEGFELAHRSELLRPQAASPTAAANRLERRVWAWTWEVDEPSWREHALPVLAELRALPDPDEPRPAVEARTLLVLDRRG